MHKIILLITLSLFSVSAFAQSTTVNNLTTEAPLLSPDLKIKFSNYFEAEDGKKTFYGNYLGANYKLSNSQDIEARQYYTDVNGESGLDALMLQHTYKTANSLKLRNRIYLPLWAKAEDNKRTEYRFYAYKKYSLAKNLDITPSTNPRLYTYSKENDGNRFLKWRNGAEVQYTVNKFVMPVLYMSHQYNDYYGSERGPENAFFMYTGLRSAPTKNIFVEILAQQEQVIDNKSLELFDKDSTLASLEVIFTL